MKHATFLVLAAFAGGQAFAEPVSILQAGEGGVVSVGDYEITADRMTQDMSGGLLLAAGRISREGRGGAVSFRDLHVTDVSLLSELLDPPEICEDSLTSGVLTFRDMRFLPDQDSGFPGLEEEIRLNLGSTEINIQGCDTSMKSVIDGVDITGADGSRLSISGLDFEISISGGDAKILDTRIDMKSLDIAGQSGSAGLSISEAGFSFRGDISEEGGLRDPGSFTSIESTIALLSRDRSSIAGHLRGFEMDPDVFFDVDDARRFGLPQGKPLSGDASFLASSDAGRVILRSSVNMSNFLKGDIDVVMSLFGGGSVFIPESIKSSIPVPEPLLGVMIERASMSYKDDGFSEIMRTILGSLPHEVIQSRMSGRVERASSRLPGGLGMALGSAWETILEVFKSGTGSFGVKPEKPFSLVEAGVSGLMGQEALSRRVGAFSGTE